MASSHMKLDQHNKEPTSLRCEKELPDCAKEAQVRLRSIRGPGGMGAPGAGGGFLDAPRC